MAEFMPYMFRRVVKIEHKGEQELSDKGGMERWGGMEMRQQERQ